MKINSKIKLTYKTNKDAKIIDDTLNVDNEDYLTSKVDGNELIYEIESDSLGSFLNTVDDLIACEIVSEKILLYNNE